MRLTFSLLLLGATAVQADTLRFDPATFDATVPVCHDPYAHVNNQWLATSSIPDHMPLWGARYEHVVNNEKRLRTLTEAAAQRQEAGQAQGAEALVGAFFRAGLDVDRIEARKLEPVAEHLQRIDAIAAADDVAATLAAFSADGLALAYNYTVWADPRDPRRTLIYLFPPTFAFGDPTTFNAPGKQAEAHRTAYLSYLVALFTAAGVDDPEAEARAAFAIERELAGAAPARDQQRDLANIFAVRTRDALQASAPGMRWGVLFDAHRHSTAGEASVAAADYFRVLSTAIDARPATAWRSFLRARFLDRLAPHLGRAFVTAHFAFHQTHIRGVPSPPPRWKALLAHLDSIHAASSALSRLYVDTHLSPGIKQSAQAMVEDVREAFRHRIERQAWMSEQARTDALAKLRNMRAKIGFPDRWPALDGLRFDATSHAANILAAWRHDRRLRDARLGKPVDRDLWLIGTPHEVNARYEPQSNELYLPAPMLIAPVFAAEQDPALNYAALGTIVAHEMTHGFDDQGAQFDSAGRLASRWTDADRERFRRAGERIADRYAAHGELEGRPVSRVLTLGENIADLGGLAIAHEALMRASTHSAVGLIDGLTQEQRFFLRYASIWRSLERPQFAAWMDANDTHAPPRARALVPLADLPAFSKAFDCRRGDRMHVADGARVGLW